MGFKPKIRVQLIKCGTCGKPYNNPLTHVCKIRMDKPPRKGAKKTTGTKSTGKKKRK